MFHYEDGLMLTGPRLAVDFRRRQPRAFVSHAHADHMARHELALCTPATARLYRHRLGVRLRVTEMPYREPLDFAGLRLTAYPAGHCLGSAMLLAEDGRERLLYTGDFKLAPSLTAEPAELPPADTLVMESTFGSAKYRLPPRDAVVAELLGLVCGALAEGRTPVVHAYALGKSQEVTALLCAAGVPVLQHRAIYGVSQQYEAAGMPLAGPTAGYGPYEGLPLPGHAVVTLPRGMRQHRLAGLGATTSIAVTGWAADPRTRFRLGVDHAVPLSDHADFDQLLEAVARVAPRVVYCTHGPRGFVDVLLGAGYDARPLAPERQRRLF